MPFPAALAPYADDMPMRPWPLFRRDPAGGVPALFQGRRAGFCDSTRVALRKAVDLLNLSPGEEVLAPAYNCGSELDPLLQAGLRIRLYPQDDQTRIDLACVERMIGPRTRALYVTHYFGVLHPDLQAMRGLADAHGLALIEDCALSLLSGRRPVEGLTGNIAVFCFYKFFPTREGGGLIINTEDNTLRPEFDQEPRGGSGQQLIRMLPGVQAVLRSRRRMRARSSCVRDEENVQNKPDMPGSYYFDPELAGRVISPLVWRLLGGFDVASTIAARRKHYMAYLAALEDMPGAQPLFPELAEETCPLSMPVLVKDRNQLAQALAARGIAATPWWAGYNRMLDFGGQTAAQHLKDHVLSLPVHQFLHPDAPGHVVSVLRGLVSYGSSEMKGGRGRRQPGGGA